MTPPSAVVPTLPGTAGGAEPARLPSLPETFLLCLGLVPPPVRRRWLALVPLLLLQAVVEFGAAASVYLFLAGTGVASRAPAPAVPFVGGALPLLAAFLLAKNALVLLTSFLSSRLLADSMRSAFERLLRGYLATPPARRALHNAVDLAHTAGPATDAAFRKVLVPAASLLSESLVAGALLSVLALRAPVAGLASAAVLALALAVTLRASQRAVVAASQRRDALEVRLVRDLNEVLGGLPEIQALGREEAVARAVLARHDAFTRAHRALASASAASRPLAELVFVAALFSASLFAPARLPGEALPLLGLLAYAAFRILPAANRVAFLVHEMRSGRPAVVRLRRDLERFPIPGPGAAAPGTPPFLRRISLEDVVVRPEGAGAPALDGLTLHVTRGEMLGVVGETGAGKSTLLSILAGLSRPDGGTVRVDDDPATLATPEHRRRVGYVPQAPFVADDSLLGNVAFGQPEDEVDPERAFAALEAVRLGAFVRALPGGLHGRAGEQGGLLSGGERQRLALARALYADRELLLLDEATSAVDAATEREIVATLRDLVPARTVVVVSHRLEAVRAADRIVVLEKGRVVASGSYAELLDGSALFRALAGAQGRPTP